MMTLSSVPVELESFGSRKSEAEVVLVVLVVSRVKVLR